MKIVVFGGAGFVGTTLLPMLVKKGHDVICFDRMFFGREFLKEIESKLLGVYEGDIRTFNDFEWLKDTDTVINLAGISQPDELKRIDPMLFFETNHLGCSRVARICKDLGVKRYISTSTCSVYGAQIGLLSESGTEPKPLEAYGKSKLLAEKDALELADNDFCVTIIRPATMYGLSKKMRFDLVVNAMSWALWKFGTINVSRPGSQWRPNVHVKDVCRAICKIMEAERGVVQKEVFNIGTTEQNYQIEALAHEIGMSASNDYNIDWFGKGDNRSYNVDFEKLETTFSFKAKYTVPIAANEIYDALESGIIEKDRKTLNLSWYQNLIAQDKLKTLKI